MRARTSRQTVVDVNIEGTVRRRSSRACDPCPRATGLSRTRTEGSGWRQGRPWPRDDPRPPEFWMTLGRARHMGTAPAESDTDVVFLTWQWQRVWWELLPARTTPLIVAERRARCCPRDPRRPPPRRPGSRNGLPGLSLYLMPDSSSTARQLKDAASRRGLMCVLEEEIGAPRLTSPPNPKRPGWPCGEGSAPPRAVLPRRQSFEVQQSRDGNAILRTSTPLRAARRPVECDPQRMSLAHRWESRSRATCCLGKRVSRCGRIASVAQMLHFEGSVVAEEPLVAEQTFFRRATQAASGGRRGQARSADLLLKHAHEAAPGRSVFKLSRR